MPHQAMQFIPDGSEHWQVVELTGKEDLRSRVLLNRELSNPQDKSENPVGHDEVKVP